MPKETTPKMVTDAINSFCHSIRQTGNPFYVQVYPFDGMLINECFPNVNSVVNTLGGKSVTGWVIWQWANIMIEAEAHAIWEAPDGKLVDVTPHINHEERILFLPDDAVYYTGSPIPNQRIALTSSPLVAELISLFNQRDQIAANSPGDTYSIPAGLYTRMTELQQILHQTAGRNEPCPCGSGLKYKKCCGQYE